MTDDATSPAHATPPAYATPPAAAPPAIPANRYTVPRRAFRFSPALRNLDDHPTAWQFPAYLDNADVPWLATLRMLYGEPSAFPASLSPEAGLLLFSLVRNIRPRVVVEVGTFLGVSTLWMAAALEAAAGDPPTTPGVRGGEQSTASDTSSTVIHCFDDFGPMLEGPWRKAAIETPRDALVAEALGRAGLEHRAVLHKGDSSSSIVACRELLRAAGGVDFALIDGDHTTDGTLKDLWAVEPVLNTGGYILLHDTFPEQCGDHEGPRHILDHIGRVAQGVYETCELYTAPLNYGMALLRRIG